MWTLYFIYMILYDISSINVINGETPLCYKKKLIVNGCNADIKY